jgi:L-iditol 2-dehydrogenase
MKAALLTGIGRFEIAEVPEPEIVNDNDVLINVGVVGVCGSDVHYYKIGKIGSQVVSFPFTIGHEAAGIVERTGRNVTRVKPGQRIAIEPSVSCGECDQCRAGRENTCRNLRFLGSPGQLEGCLRSRIVLPEQCCFPIAESMTLEQAALSEPLAIALYSVDKSAFHPGASAAILGVGPIGMSVFHVLRVENAGNVYVTDKIDERLEFSKRLAPEWRGNADRLDVVGEIANREPFLLDVVFECSGDAEAIGQAVRLLKPGGRLVLIGIPEMDEVVFPVHELRRNEITIVNVRRQAHCTRRAIDLIERRSIDLDSLVTHRFELDETQKAFDLVARYADGVMKAVISVG